MKNMSAAVRKAHTSHGGDVRRETSLTLKLSKLESCPQLEKRVASKHGAEE
jgi:hypothetical protein